jgi:hypothetical protein
MCGRRMKEREEGGGGGWGRERSESMLKDGFIRSGDSFARHVNAGQGHPDIVQKLLERGAKDLRATGPLFPFFRA